MAEWAAAVGVMFPFVLRSVSMKTSKTEVDINILHCCENPRGGGG